MKPILTTFLVLACFLISCQINKNVNSAEMRYSTSELYTDSLVNTLQFDLLPYKATFDFSYYDQVLFQPKILVDSNIEIDTTYTSYADNKLITYILNLKKFELSQRGKSSEGHLSHLGQYIIDSSSYIEDQSFIDSKGKIILSSIVKRYKARRDGQWLYFNSEGDTIRKTNWSLGDSIIN